MCVWVIVSEQWKKQHENLLSTQRHPAHNTRGVFVSAFGCVFRSLCVSFFFFSLSLWVVIFTQSYTVTAQIINYSSSRERDSKRGSVTIPDRKVGADKSWFIKKHKVMVLSS